MKRNIVLAVLVLLGASACDNSQNEAQRVVLKGDAAYKEGRFGEAVREWEKATKIYAGNARVHNKIAQVLLHKISGEETTALEHLNKAVELEPANAEYRYQLGWLLCELKRWGDAESHLKKAIDLDRDHAMAHFRYAVVLEEKGEYDPARKEYERSIELNPGVADAYLRLALLYARFDQYPEAIAVSKNASENNKDSAEVYNNLGVIYMAMQDYPSAISSFQGAISRKENYGKAIYGLGAASFFSGNYDVAAEQLTLFRKAVTKGDEPMVVQQADSMLGKIQDMKDRQQPPADTTK